MIKIYPAVELFTKSNKNRDCFWLREAKRAQLVCVQDVPEDAYIFQMNIGATGRLVLNCDIHGRAMSGDGRIEECPEIFLLASDVAINVNRGDWHKLEFEQGLNPENPREIVAHLTQDAFSVNAMRRPCRADGDTLSRRFARIDIKVHFDIGEELITTKKAKARMHCKVCLGNLRKYVKDKASGLGEQPPQLARTLASRLGQGTQAVGRGALRLMNWRTWRSDRTHN